jgi:hypothetical protein
MFAQGKKTMKRREEGLVLRTAVSALGCPHIALVNDFDAPRRLKQKNALR